MGGEQPKERVGAVEVEGGEGVRVLPYLGNRRGWRGVDVPGTPLFAVNEHVQDAGLIPTAFIPIHDAEVLQKAFELAVAKSGGVTLPERGQAQRARDLGGMHHAGMGQVEQNALGKVGGTVVDHQVNMTGFDCCCRLLTEGEGDL